jgi:hypothetical protein
VSVEGIHPSERLLAVITLVGSDSEMDSALINSTEHVSSSHGF